MYVLIDHKNDKWELKISKESMSNTFVFFPCRNPVNSTSFKGQLITYYFIMCLASSSQFTNKIPFGENISCVANVWVFYSICLVLELVCRLGLSLWACWRWGLGQLVKPLRGSYVCVFRYTRSLMHASVAATAYPLPIPVKLNQHFSFCLCFGLLDWGVSFSSHITCKSVLGASREKKRVF